MVRVLSYLLIVLSLASCKLMIPAKYKQYAAEVPWQYIRMAHDGEAVVQSDSTVILYSNRTFHPERKKALGDYIDSSGATRPFLVVCKSGQWVVYPLASVEEGVLKIGKKRNVVVYQEGMGKNFQFAADRAFALSVEYDVTVVMMDYPSINVDLGLHGNFKFARKSAYQTAPCMLSLLKELERYKAAGKEWTQVRWTLFFHSMGNICLKRMLEEDLTNGLDGMFDLLVLNAPCVAEKNHAAWLGKSRLAKNTLLHYNKDDKQLNGAEILLLYNTLGTEPHKPLAANATYVNFNLLVGKRHSTFSDFKGRAPIKPNARWYYGQVFQGTLPDFSDTSKFSTGGKGLGFSLK
jgi:hypothetical protein